MYHFTEFEDALFDAGLCYATDLETHQHFWVDHTTGVELCAESPVYHVLAFWLSQNAGKTKGKKK
jgi:hypothetical protein